MITKLKIKNFKCFGEEREMQFARFNVLYGKNGRGKSTAMQSLLLLSQNIRKKNTLTNVSLKGELIDLGNYLDVVNRYSQSGLMTFGISTDMDDELILSLGKSEVGPTLLHLEDLWCGSKQLVSNVGTEMEDSWETKNSEAMSGIKALEFFRQLRYVSANRRGPTNYEERQDDFLSDDIGINGERLINALAKKDQNFINELQEALSYILSGATIGIKNDENSDNVELLLDSMDDSLGFKPSNVGYGYSCVLPIIFLVLSAKEGSTLMIENPEAHLYPGAQSRLVEWMVTMAIHNNLQIILETHSDHIINGLRIAVKKNKVGRNGVSILFLDRKSQRQSPDILTIRVDNNGTLNDNPTDFMDEWTKQMLELL
ncbi:MAG: DUF3696 domain-containing protein [Mediterranea massiliensis]|nr:DUF3696 domain-containing protein [Mediterranea massiliensis]